MWTIFFKVFNEFVTILLLRYVFWFFWPRGMWDLSSLTCTPCTRRQSLNHWTAREVPDWTFLRDYLASLATRGGGTSIRPAQGWPTIQGPDTEYPQVVPLRNCLSWQWVACCLRGRLVRRDNGSFVSFIRISSYCASTEGN